MTSLNTHFDGFVSQYQKPGEYTATNTTPQESNNNSAWLEKAKPVMDRIQEFNSKYEYLKKRSTTSTPGMKNLFSCLRQKDVDVAKRAMYFEAATRILSTSASIMIDVAITISLIAYTILGTGGVLPGKLPLAIAANVIIVASGLLWCASKIVSYCGLKHTLEHQVRHNPHFADFITKYNLTCTKVIQGVNYYKIFEGYEAERRSIQAEIDSLNQTSDIQAGFRLD